MYRALPVSRHIVGATGRGLLRVTRRRFTTETTPPPAPKKKRRVLRSILLTTVTVTAGFYLGSTFVAFNNERYYDFFSDRVPLGQALLDYGETHHWDTLTMKKVFESGKDTAINLQRYISNKLSGNSAISGAEKKEEASTFQTRKAELHQQSKDRLRSVASALKTNVERSENDLGRKATAIARHQASQFSDGVEDLIRKAEAVLVANPTDVIPQATAVSSGPVPSPPDTVPSPSSDPGTSVPPNTIIEKQVYSSPLPIEFEPPPGYYSPKPPKKDAPVQTNEASPAPAPLPLITPAVSQFSDSEPVIVQLASTIDGLASYLDSNPVAAAKAKDVLESAKIDLTELATRIERIREEEQVQLERQLDEQSREYTIKLLELELEAQDKLDSQEEGFRKYLDEEKAKFVQAYREKLDNELRVQTELINERLKEEVIAQGIEMQRRWIREIKIRVEQERGGRLAKLDELSADIRRLERIALDNASYLDENMRVHALWSALRAFNNAVEAPVRKPFREELRVLRHLTVTKEDPVISAVLDSLEETDVPDIGVEPLADLISWFTTSVAPRVSSVALVPDENAGVLSHLASHFLSSFRFQRHGLVPGSDVLSVLARAEYYMNEKDLDSAARELNQLKGTAKVLLRDWLEATRRRLEVLQSLEVIQTQATLASLLIV